jgi:hypothetical protein
VNEIPLNKTQQWLGHAAMLSYCTFLLFVVMCTHEYTLWRDDNMAMQSIGLREFRANLHKYTSQSLDPIIVTSHGVTIGYYIPARPSTQEQDLTALKEAVRKIAALLEASGVQEEEIMADFQKARQLEMQA